MSLSLEGQVQEVLVLVLVGQVLVLVLVLGGQVLVNIPGTYMYRRRASRSSANQKYLTIK